MSGKKMYTFQMKLLKLMMMYELAVFFFLELTWEAVEYAVHKVDTDT